MKPIQKIILIAALVACAAGITAIGVAYAQEGGPREGLAELLGMTKEEIQEQLQSGRTIQELAQDAGVDLEAFREENRANRQEELRTRIKEALANGDISQDQADWLLEGLENGYMEGLGFRFGARDGDPAKPQEEGMQGRRGGNLPATSE